MHLVQPCVTFYFLCLTSLVTSSTLSSPESKVDLNSSCTSINSFDGYPRIFEPTLKFKKIREGQELPPGLHVRMNIYTGEKEARLNVPMMEEDDTSGNDDQPLSLETALIKVDEEISHQKPLQYQEAIASQEKIQTPLSLSELQKFQNSIAMLKMKGPLFDQALEDLSELAHDIYYGREIAREDSILELLVCLTLGLALENIPKEEINRERTAASVLGSAFQNNPAAIKEINNVEKNIIYPSCTPNSANKNAKKDNFISIFRNKLEKEQDSHTLKIKIITLNRLLKSHKFRDLFLKNEGLELLLAIFLKEGENFNAVKKKISELLTDNFLDESYGAQTNIWPKYKRSSSTFCKQSQNRFHDGCWEHHIEEFSTQVPTEDWPKNLLLALKNRRPKRIPLEPEI